MQYKEVYALLNERRNKVSGFSYTDRSGWRVSSPSYIDHYRPLWIIAEDPACSRRIWITQEGSEMQITVAEMDEQGHNHNSALQLSCRSKTALAAGLRKLFVQEVAAA